LFRPQKLDTDKWLEAAKAAGWRYAIVTATNFNGSVEKQSDQYPDGLRQTSWSGGKADTIARSGASIAGSGMRSDYW